MKETMTIEEAFKALNEKPKINEAVENEEELTACLNKIKSDTKCSMSIDDLKNDYEEYYNEDLYPEEDFECSIPEVMLNDYKAIDDAAKNYFSDVKSWRLANEDEPAEAALNVIVTTADGKDHYLWADTQGSSACDSGWMFGTDEE